MVLLSIFNVIYKSSQWNRIVSFKLISLIQYVFCTMVFLGLLSRPSLFKEFSWERMDWLWHCSLFYWSPLFPEWRFQTTTSQVFKEMFPIQHCPWSQMKIKWTLRDHNLELNLKHYNTLEIFCLGCSSCDTTWSSAHLNITYYTGEPHLEIGDIASK